MHLRSGWSDCPTCGGVGNVPGTACLVGTSLRDDCPTCAAHFSALDAAVVEISEEYERMIALLDNMGSATGEDWEVLARDYSLAKDRIAAIRSRSAGGVVSKANEGGE